ncbi:MAG TPA: hypothetical protein VMH34_03575 [Gammaproteobacteria bacterium]|nr:hypothetical protein [Gammaproteobacteria bacterium]
MNMNAVTLAVLMAGLTSQAHAIGSLTDVTVYDRREHRTLPVYEHNGRYYVVGRPGNEYQINLRNQSGGDVLTVISVDGVNAVTGETAGWGQTGYVLNTSVAAEIAGWRKSQDRTAAFYFTRLPDSYAARTDRPDNVGVIGVAVFRRKDEPQPVPYPAFGREDGSNSHESKDAANEAAAGALAKQAPAAALRDDGLDRKAMRSESRLGTGHGRSEYSYVTYTDFERATETPAEIISIYYDSYNNLVAQGVIPYQPLAIRPFPGNFVPDP